MFEVALIAGVTWCIGVQRWRLVSSMGRRARERGVGRAGSLIVIIGGGRLIIIITRRIFHLVLPDPSRMSRDPAAGAPSGDLKLTSIGQQESSIFLLVSSLS